VLRWDEGRKFDHVILQEEFVQLWTEIAAIAGIVIQIVAAFQFAAVVRWIMEMDL